MNGLNQERIETGENLNSIVAKAAAVLSSGAISTGERASLKKMDPRFPPPLFFYSFAIRVLPEDWFKSAEDWITIIAGMSIMSPNPHDPSKPLGRALSEAGYSEKRLERLLSSQGTTLRVLFLRMVRFLSAKGTPFNWVEGAVLLLSRRGEEREKIRKKIAIDFYRGVQKQN